MDRDWRAVFERTYAGPASVVHERVWREVFGDEYPEGLDPYSFVSRTELDRFVNELRVGTGDLLVDMGCGRGGAGLWIAAATGAALVGIDIAEAALAAARTRAQAMGMQAEFRRGSFESTGLGSSTANAVMSIDALLFTQNKAAALRELRRIVRAGGRLVLTSWDYHRQPVGRPPQVDDHRPLLSAAGFDVKSYQVTDNWLDRLRRTTRGLLDACDEVAAEAGSTPAETRVQLEEMAATIDTMSRRFLLVADAV